MTETTTDFITADIVEVKPGKQELDYAILELDHICSNVQLMNDNAGEGYKAVRKMAGKSYISMREQDLGFMRGYWMGLNAALIQIDRILDELKDLRSELSKKEQENENAGD